MIATSTRACSAGTRCFGPHLTYVGVVADGSEQAPAGWYDDPHQPGRMRYFDGEVWTNHFHEPGKLPDIGTWLNTTFTGLLAHWPGPLALAFFTAFLGNVITWSVLRNVFSDVAIVDDEFVNFSSSKVPLLLFVFVANLLLQSLIWLALSRFMQRAHYQADPTIADALIHGLSRLPRFIGALLMIFAAFVAVVLVIALFAAIAPFLAVLALLGIVVLLVWAVVKLAFIAPAAVAAPPSLSVIRTSAQVSDGRFWPIFGRILMFVVVLPLATNIVSAVFGKYGSVIDSQATAQMFDTTGGGNVFLDTQLRDLFPSPGTFAIAAIVASVIGAITTLISTSAAMRLYLDSGAPSEITANSPVD